MGNIPVFTRTVLPQRAQYGLVDVARTKGQQEAAQFRQDAANTEQARHASLEIQGKVNDYRLREAEAKNTTWVNESVIQAKKDVTDMLDARRQERAGSPSNFHKDFDKELEKAQAGYLKAAPSEAARIAFRQSYGNIRAGFYDDNQRWERGRQTELFAESMERSADNLNVLAYRAGQKGQPIDQYLNDAEASAVAGSTFVDPENVAKIQRTMRRGTIANYLEGMSEQNPGKVREILKSGKYDKDLDVDEIQRLDQAAEAEIKRGQAEARLAVSDDIEEIQTAAKLGLKVPQNELDAIIGKTAALGMEKESQKLREFSALQNDMSAFAILPLKEQAAQIQSLKTSIEGGNLEQVNKYAAFSEILNTKAEAVQKDPYAYYAAHEIIREPQPIDFANPAAMGAELDQRRVSAQQVKDLDGIQIPLFTPGEISQLKSTFENSEPRQMAALLSGFNQSMKPDEIGALAKAMAPQSSTLAVAIANGDPSVGEKILMGTQAKGDVSADKVRDAVNDRISGAIIDPGKLEPIHDAIYAYYKQMSVMAGDADSEVNSDRMDKAISDIMGPVATIGGGIFGGGSKVLSYKDQTTGAWVDEDRLNDILMGITDKGLKETNGALPQGPSGGVWSAEKIKKSARFVSAGDGKYTAIVDGLGYVSDQFGRPYIFNARALEPYVQPDNDFGKGRIVP